VAADAPGLTMLQIGGDAGFIYPPVPLTGQLVNGLPATHNFLVLASGERADVVIDFSALAGKSVYLSNHATEASPLGNGGDLAIADPATLPIRICSIRCCSSAFPMRSLSQLWTWRPWRLR
jgi:hypothetical protein